MDINETGVVQIGTSEFPSDLIISGRLVKSRDGNDLFVQVSLLRQELISLKKNIHDVQQTLLQLCKQVEEIYYSPGMPGYFEHKNHFYSLSEQNNQ